MKNLCVLDRAFALRIVHMHGEVYNAMFKVVVSFHHCLIVSECIM